jgi:hypothetical protein
MRDLCSYSDLKVADHDFTPYSLQPSVQLFVKIPETADEPFGYDGQVYVAVKDHIFQSSDSLRHVVELTNSLTEQGNVQPIFFSLTDGGPDHRLTFLSVQLTLIALALHHDFDYMHYVRTAPHGSFLNPVERIMSILNLGLYGLGIARGEMSPVVYLL